MPRFVILEHDHPALHWDLMLEAGDVLQTWRLAAPPDSAASIDAAELGDHRAAYLDYQGPVSGNRGTVKRWDTGDFTEDERSTPDVRSLHFEGTRLRGNARLSRIHGDLWCFECGRMKDEG